MNGKGNYKLTCSQPGSLYQMDEHGIMPGQLANMKSGELMGSTAKNECMWSDWHGCYDGGWNGLIVPEAFAHPAKMSYSLLCRIIRTGLERGYWKPGSTLIEPFSGIGSTAIVATYYGIRTIGCELEPRFHKLALENAELHRRKWETLKAPQPVFINGDSRKLAQLVQEQCAGMVASPPFSDPGNQPPNIRGSKPVRSRWKDEPDRQAEYGQTPGQLGAMPIGSIASPPYEASPITDARNFQSEKCPDSRPAKECRATGYGGLETSPPWENQEPSHGQGSAPSTIRLMEDGKASGHGRQFMQAEYGTTEGQIGNTTGDTFWSVAALILSQCHQLLVPGSVTAWVCKDFVRKRQRVPFCDDWCRLLESCGFHVFERTRCWLTKETCNAGLFGDVKKTKERKSFFRRLAEKKGSPRIDFEQVIWAVKVGENGGSCTAGISSPPYTGNIETPHYQQGAFSADPQRMKDHTHERQEVNRRYGITNGNISNLPEGQRPE